MNGYPTRCRLYLTTLQTNYTNFCPGKDRYLHPIILDAVGRRLTNSIPSNNGKYNLILFVEDNSFLFVRGELDYFNDRNPGQIIPDHNSNYSSFYLEAGDTQVFFDKFKCLYNYGAYSWWDSSSRYFYFASAVNLFFIFDCQEYKWAQISTPFDIVSGYIENGLVMIDGFEPFNVAGTLKVGANAPMLTLQLSDLSWKTKGLKIKKHEPENLQPATLPRQESIALNKQSVAPKEHSSSQKSFKKNLVKGIKIILSIGIIFAVAGLAVSLRAGHRSVFLLVSLCLGAISLIFLSGNSADSLEDDVKEMYRAWLVIKFGYWLPLFIIILTGTITAFSDEYRTSLFNQFAFGLSIAYFIFIPFTEMRGILLLKGNSEDREICRERYKSERKKGKKTLRFFLELHLRKLILFFILAGAVVLIVELSDYLFSLFQ